MVGFFVWRGGVRMFGAVFPAPSCAHFSPREENPSSPRGGHLSGVFFGSGGGWGFRAGLTEPLSGHERCVEELAATEPVRAGVVWCNLFHSM